MEEWIPTKEVRMAIIVSFVSQKGGCAKSTLARLLAREFAAQQWNVKIADLDISQGTCFQWRTRRLAHQIEPDVPVEQFGSVERALKVAEHYDMLIFDGAPHSSSATQAAAFASSLTVIPTGLAIDDLQPAVLLAHDLVKSGIARGRIVLALCKVGDSMAEIEDARAYLQKAGYAVLQEALPEKVGYRRASDEGKALTETRFPSLNERAEKVAQNMVDLISQISSSLTTEDRKKKQGVA